MGGPAKVAGKALFGTDNFYKASFVVEGKEYCSSENYFQCCKAVSPEEHEKVRASGPGIGCWEAGNHVKLRKDWDRVRVRVMYKANLQKFRQNKDILQELVESRGEVDQSTSSPFWNKWNSLILAGVRAELRQDGEEDRKTLEKVQAAILEYETSFDK